MRKVKLFPVMKGVKREAKTMAGMTGTRRTPAMTTRRRKPFSSIEYDVL
jgi:hypothetical protein